MAQTPDVRSCDFFFFSSCRLNAKMLFLFTSLFLLGFFFFIFCQVQIWSLPTQIGAEMRYRVFTSTTLVSGVHVPQQLLTTQLVHSLIHYIITLDSN